MIPGSLDVLQELQKEDDRGFLLVELLFLCGVLANSSSMAST